MTRIRTIKSGANSIRQYQGRPSNMETVWLKKDKISNLDAVKKYYRYSSEKALQAMRVLSKDQIEFIKKKLNTGGRI